MKRTSLSVSAVLFLMSLSLVLPAPQEAGAMIVVKGGSLEEPGFLSGDLSLFSDQRGFSLIAHGLDNGDGIFDPSRSPFKPGDTISLRAGWTDSDLDGAFTIDGVPYGMGFFTFPLSCISFPPVCGNGGVDFFGSTVAPPFDGLTSTAVTAPFTFSGRIEYVTNPATLATARETLTGEGTATINLTRLDTPLFSVWEFNSARYDFRIQTPEPSALILLGSGLAAVGVFRLRRKREG